MANKKMNIGVIGLGRLGYHHAMNVTKTMGANLVAVADPNQLSLEKAANDFDVQGFLNYKEMIKLTTIDAFIVATPTKTHFDVLMDVIAIGKPIFVEKPITFTVEEAEKIYNTVKEKNIFLQVGFMRRFDPGHVAAKKMIQSGACGSPIYIHDCQRDPNGPPPAYVPESGGLFVDMGIHDLDVARWLMGSEIIEIYAQGAVLKHEFLKDLNDVDDGQMLLKFQSGALGMIEISRNANDVYDTRTEIIGKEKSVFVGQEQLTPFKLVCGQEITYDMANWCLGRFKDAYELEIQAFVNNVLEGKPSPVDAYDGLIGIKLALIATKSHLEKKAIQITY